MTKLLVVADDFTGALDTGIQFAKKGISTKVFLELPKDSGTLKDMEVVVVNTSSRHVEPEEAKKRVFEAVSFGTEQGIAYFYKKTDSALRGNIGSELNGMLAASKETCLTFVPAYPKMNRTTDQGVHYIDGIPVAKSIFGTDPFEPVLESDVALMIEKQEKDSSVTLKKPGEDIEKTKGIVLYNCCSEEDLNSIAESIRRNEQRVFAGCAGFAAYLPKIIPFESRSKKRIDLDSGLVVVTGSVNPKTLSQLSTAEKNGFTLIVLTEEQKTDPAYPESEKCFEFYRGLSERFSINPRLAVCSIKEDKGYTVAGGNDAEALRHQISENIGKIAAGMIREIDAPFLIIGGDVLQAIFKEIHVSSVEPVAEPVPGVVLCEIDLGGKKRTLFTKSGGFGDEDTILEVEAFCGMQIE